MIKLDVIKKTKKYIPMKNKYSFTQKDIEQIRALGLAPSDVYQQLENYRRGPNYLKLIRPCTPGDGIRSLTRRERNLLIKLYDGEAAKHRILKFIPASGAASRMFADWYAAARQGSFGNATLDRSFFRNLRKMPFFSMMEKDDTLRLMIRKRNVQGVLNYIFLSTGLHFDGLPKALIPFHAYREDDVRTALEEHLGEAVSFIAGTDGICRLHFTISAEHARAVKTLLKSLVSQYEKRCGVRFEVNLSVQSEATNMVAVDENDLPFRDGRGCLIFRPGGHGALLKNLQALDADLIFVKNIDNIAPDNLQKKILPYKKMLGGLALQLQQSVFALLRRLEKDQLSTRELQVITDFCRAEFKVSLPKGFSMLPPKERMQWLFFRLNRPLRICGMVRNVGEPGGGPFWVQEKDKSQTLQIVESGHVDHRRASQADIWSRALYFNPVDMVCCIKNYRGEKFDLAGYVNRDAYLISPKTEKGRKLRAQEMPGLWNGSMACWNTVFVELPLAVLNPVKPVYDLLRPQHKSGRAIK